MKLQNAGRVIALIDIFGRMTPVEFECHVCRAQGVDAENIEECKRWGYYDMGEPHYFCEFGSRRRLRERGAVLDRKIGSSVPCITRSGARIALRSWCPMATSHVGLDGPRRHRNVPE
jgi:hypothetical protein